MSRYSAEDLLKEPATLDDIATALKNKNAYGSNESLSILHQLVKGEIKYKSQPMGLEQFNFGPLDLDEVRAAQLDAIDFITNKCFTMPYQHTLYRCALKYDNATIGQTILTAEYAERDGPHLGVTRIVRATDGRVFATSCINSMVTQLNQEGMCVQMQIPQFELEYWNRLLPNQKETEWQCTEGALISMGLTMILNTKGVLKERSAPPAKPNKTRAAQGRPLLPYTTRVYTAVYNQAVQSGVPGTHASPRPHIRRAHVRHYPKTERHEAYVLPIAAMLVNWDGKPLQPRQEYIVK